MAKVVWRNSLNSDLIINTDPDIEPCAYVFTKPTRHGYAWLTSVPHESGFAPTLKAAKKAALDYIASLPPAYDKLN
jgi:hypothetical protein